MKRTWPSAPRWITGLVRLSRREYFADFFITPPITLALACYSLYVASSVWWPAFFVAGWIAWTLYEYGVHRFVAHGLWPFNALHGLHHKNQRDYIAIPPWATLTIYVVFALTFGIGSSAFAVGYSFGYVVYALLHTAYHYAHITPRSWLWCGKQRHVAHHRYDDVCYGVTHGLWDRVFKTNHEVT